MTPNGHTGSSPRFSTLWVAAVGWYELPITSVPDESADGPSSWLWVDWSVRAYGRICPSAVCSRDTSEESVPSRVAADAVAENSAWSAARSVVGSCTAHCVSCALSTECSKTSEPNDCHGSTNV